MRLSDYEIEQIRQLARKHFGENVHVYLFGSRTNQQQRGGDIDLFIQAPEHEQLRVRAKICFMTELVLKIGEQKLDVVLDHRALQNSPFLKTIHETAIQLC